MQTPHFLACEPTLKLEVFTTWDADARVYELWTDSRCVEWIGCADDRQEAIRIAWEWFRDCAKS